MQHEIKSNLFLKPSKMTENVDLKNVLNNFDYSFLCFSPSNLQQNDKNAIAVILWFKCNCNLYDFPIEYYSFTPTAYLPLKVVDKSC